MQALYVVSLEPGAGKTTLCVGLAQRYQGSGLEVGYLKPLTLGPPEQAAADGDAAFLRRLLGLRETVGELCPVALEPQAAVRLDFLDRLEAAYRRAAQGKELMVLEGPAVTLEASLAPVLQGIAAALGARILLVVRHGSQVRPTEVATLAKRLRPQLLGIVVNAVPTSRLRTIRADLVEPWERQGLRVVGVIPEEWSLLGVSVAEVAQYLQGEVLVAAERSQELVEHFMLGILTSDSIAPYFRRYSRKAVIARGDRPDVHLAALRTEVACLLIPGELPPEPDVLAVAAERQVPVVRVHRDTLALCEALGGVFAQARFRQLGKLSPLAGLLASHLSWAALEEGLGLPA